MLERRSQMDATLKGAAYIADFLVQQKVPYIFGLCGHGILGLLDGLYDRRDEITTISVHHEAVAAVIADAYFRIAQRPVATYTSCGPGSAKSSSRSRRRSPTRRQRSTSRGTCPRASGTVARSRRPAGTFRGIS
jgi:hypothetical protein